MKITRRKVFAGAGIALGGAGAVSLGRAVAEAGSVGAFVSETAATATSAKAHLDLMMMPGLQMHGSEQVVMILYPGFTALDFVAPQFVFSSMLGATVHLATTENDLSPLRSDTGISITPTIRLADVPDPIDLIFLPGGAWATVKAMENKGLMDFLTNRGPKAKYLTSVCTGSLLLGQAGLLNGKKATSHWLTRDLLSLFGAIPTDGRVVQDGNIVTGGGVTAGFDFALTLLAQMRGQPYAEAIQLQAEYSPAPPFNAGSPASAPPAITKALTDMFAPVIDGVQKVAAARRA